MQRCTGDGGWWHHHQGPIFFQGILMKFLSRSVLQFPSHQPQHKLDQVLAKVDQIIVMEHILHFEKKPREARAGKFVWVVSLSKLRGQNWDLRGGSVEQINKGQSKITELTWQNTQLTINSTVPMSIEFVVYSLFLAEALELAFEAWSHCVLTTRQLNIIHKWTCV